MSTKSQPAKEQIISALVQARRELLEAASTLPVEKQDQVFLGTWSVKDLLAHLVGWDFTNAEATQEVLAGRLPGFYAHHDRDWQTYNASLVARYKQDDFAALLSSVQDSHRQLVDLLEAVPAGEFNKDRGVRVRRYRVTLAHLLQAETRDEQKHGTQLRAFKDR